MCRAPKHRTSKASQGSVGRMSDWMPSWLSQPRLCGSSESGRHKNKAMGRLCTAIEISGVQKIEPNNARKKNNTLSTHTYIVHPDLHCHPGPTLSSRTYIVIPSGARDLLFAIARKICSVRHSERSEESLFGGRPREEGFLTPQTPFGMTTWSFLDKLSSREEG